MPTERKSPLFIADSIADYVGALSRLAVTIAAEPSPAQWEEADEVLEDIMKGLTTCQLMIVPWSCDAMHGAAPHPCSTRPVPASVQDQRKSGVELAAIAMAKDAEARMANGIPNPDLRIADHPRDVPGIPAGHNGTEGELLSEGERPAILSQ